jgi:alkylation response protein AidB-like acyl-CoA dehydrogenase/enoyl-CoA hydratase/carnithine racemase
MPFETIVVERPEPRIARIVMNRPEARNAQNLQMTYDLNAAFDEAVQDDAVKVIILAGNGPHFSSGHDLRPGGKNAAGVDFPPVGNWGGFAEPNAHGRFAREQEIYLQITRRWRNLAKPTIAEVHGKCIAGGLMLAWACDLIVASHDAEFCDPVVTMGVCGVEWFVHPWELGPRKAKELLFTADVWSAEEAHRLGMVNHVVPRDELSSHVMKLAERIAAKPSFALKLTKEAVNRSVDVMGQPAAIEQAFALHQLCHAQNLQEFGMVVDPSGLHPSGRNEPLGFSAAIWKQFADLGWLALPIPEAHGGLGGGSIETGILMEAFGRGLVSEPYLSTVVIGASMISECGTEAQKQALLPKIAEGSLYLAFAHSERQARFDLADVRTTAKKTSDGWRLDGQKTAVLDGSAANQIIVSARLDDGRICPFLVPQGARDLVSRDYPRLGGGRACNLELSGVELPADALLGDGSDALPAIEAVVDRAMAALGSEAVGIMQTLLDQTLEYTKIRKQFGRPLSANQVIRHRLADMAMQCDEARSMALRAALMADAEPVARSRAASGAKAKIGKCARFVAEQSVQLHGAMGVTEELDIGSYFKRLLAFDTLFGGSAHHFRRYAVLGGRAIQA